MASVQSRAYRPQRGRRHVTQHLAKFKSGLKIVKISVFAQWCPAVAVTIISYKLLSGLNFCVS